MATAVWSEFFLPRDLYGQLAIFGNDNRSPFTVEAVEECRVMYIGKDLFYRPCSNVCPTHQRLIQNMLALLANQAALLDKKDRIPYHQKFTEKNCSFPLRGIGEKSRCGPLRDPSKPRSIGGVF